MRYKPRLELVDTPNTLKSFQKHIDSLKTIYGALIIFNLVDKTGQEAVVGSAMSKLFSNINDDSITYEIAHVLLK